MTSLKDISQEIKDQIKRDYLAGMPVPSIATKYGFKHSRSVYFSLKPLTLEDKIQHLRNK